MFVMYVSGDEVLITTKKKEESFKKEFINRDWSEFHRTEIDDVGVSIDPKKFED